MATPATSTPTANAVPKANGSNKIANGWLDLPAIFGSVLDTELIIGDAADPTKQLKFDVNAGMTASKALTINTGAQTDNRTLSVPVLSGNDTLVTLGTTQTLTGTKTFSADVILGAETASRIVVTGASKDLDTPASISTDQSVTITGDFVAGTITTTGKTRGAYFVTTVGQNSLPSGDDSVAMIFMTGASGSAPFNNEGSLVYRARVSATSARSSHYWYTGSPSTVKMTLAGTGDFSLTSTTDSTSKDTGSIVTEGGLGVEKAIYAGTAIRSVSPTAGIGYATGAGGTVAQGSGSGKATGVTLNTVCGTITMDGATLNADTTVAFTLTNSAIAATDLVVIQHSSVGTLGAYNFAVTPAGGSATVSVRNVTPGNLSEAIVLRFAIIKAVTA